MGYGATAQLVFGIDLGEELPNDWDEYEDFDFDEYLLEDSGLPEWSADMADEESSQYFKDRNDFLDKCPVEIVHYCHYAYTMRILALRGSERNAHQGDCMEVTKDTLEIPEEKIAAFKQWCEEFIWSGLVDKEPKWLMCSIYG